MNDNLRITILGCGSSGGVPRVGGADGLGEWGACDPKNLKNRRQRCALLVERFNGQGITRIVVDTGPDLREQLIQNGIRQLDAAIYTHDHADHTHGIDDLRAIVLAQKHHLPVWADPNCAAALRQRFSYLFVQPPNSIHPPILDLYEFKDYIRIEGAGGMIMATAFAVPHGGITAYGFRFGDIAYIPDLHDLPQAAFEKLHGLDVLIIDALRYKPHPAHANVEQALHWIKQLKPKQGVLTNLHVDLDYDQLNKETPDHVCPAYDGLQISTKIYG